MRVRIARDELRRIRELSQTIKALEARSPGSSPRIAPQLLTEPGFGPLTAAKLVGEVAGAGQVLQRCQARARRRRRSDPGQLRQDQPPPPGPRRQPPDQRHHPPHRRHPPALPPRDAGLHRPQTRRRQEHQGSDPLPQAPPRPAHLAPAPAAPPRPRNTAITHQSLDIGAAKAQSGSAHRGASLVASHGMRRKPRGDVLGCRFLRRAVVDLLDEGRLSLNLAHPPSGGTIPVNTEFAILGVAAGSPAQPAAPPRERRSR